MIIMENELRQAMRHVIDAETVVKAWKEEVTRLKKDFKKLMDAATAAASVTGATFDRVTESDRIRASVLAEMLSEVATEDQEDDPAPDHDLYEYVNPHSQANDTEDLEDEDTLDLLPESLDTHGTGTD